MLMWEGGVVSADQWLLGTMVLCGGGGFLYLHAVWGKEVFCGGGGGWQCMIASAVHYGILGT